MDFGHRVGGTLFNPASLTHGCMGKHCGVKPSWDYRRCTEAKESPGHIRGFQGVDLSRDQGALDATILTQPCISRVAPKYRPERIRQARIE